MSISWNLLKADLEQRKYTIVTLESDDSIVMDDCSVKISVFALIG